MKEFSGVKVQLSHLKVNQYILIKKKKIERDPTCLVSSEN